MNKWIEKSIKLANSQGYLDDLLTIYPVEAGVCREISDEIKKEVQEAFRCSNKKELIKELLKFPKFPIDDPYISSLRRHPDLLSKNPKTINRVGNILLSIKLDAILNMAIKPKSASRQFGSSFRSWLHSLKYNFLNEKEFKSNNEVSFLDGSDNVIKKFIVKELGLKKLNRRPDFLLKVKNNYVLGEAKFLTSHGGAQNNQFDGALKMAKIKKGNIFGIAVIDGIVWFDGNSYMNRVIKRSNNIALSALLLEKFIKEF